jgi:hypothetical protein
MWKIDERQIDEQLKRSGNEDREVEMGCVCGCNSHDWFCGGMRGLLAGAQ